MQRTSQGVGGRSSRSAKPDDPAYAAARAAYLAGGESVAAIARRLGIRTEKIFRWRRTYAWREPGTPGPESRVTGKPPRATGSGREVPLTAEQKRAVVARIWRAIDAALTRLETAMTTGDPTSPADSERETRAIGALIRNLAKATELEADVAPTRSDDGKNGPAVADDPERLRAALAQRLGRVRGSDDRGDSGGSG